jgi:RNA polymerase sigma-70 factor (ECF subfamily)
MMEATASADLDVNEAVWIRRCKRGHRRAFEPLVRRYGPRAYGFALGKVKDPEEAKELSQGAFLRAFRAIDRFDESRPFYPWLLTILRNLCISHLRRQRPMISIDDMPPAKQGTKPKGLSPELRLSLKQALDSLSESDRELVILKDFQDLTYNEISAILNVPRGTVQSRLYYARRRLRDHLNGVLPHHKKPSSKEDEGASYEM